MKPLGLPLHYVAQAVSPSGLWTKLVAFLTGFAWGYVADQHAERQAISTLMVMIALDVVTGIFASFKRGRKLSSRRLADTAYKFLGYACVIIAAAAIDKVMPDGFTRGAVVGITTFFIGAELLSLLENARHLGIKRIPYLSKIADALLSESGEEDPRGPKKVRKGP